MELVLLAFDTMGGWVAWMLDQRMGDYLKIVYI